MLRGSQLASLAFVAAKLIRKTSAAVPRVAVSIVAAYLLALGSVSAAETKSIPLLDTGDITKPGVGYQAATGNASGSIHYSDEVLAYPIVETADNRALVEAWRSSHRFFVVPVEISISPAPGLTPKHVYVNLAFSGLGQLTKQPLIIDIFPQKEFTPGPVGANVELSLDSDLKFNRVIGGADADAKGTLVVKYASSYADIISGFGSATAFWQFAVTQTTQPTGNLPLKLVVACPVGMLGKNLFIARTSIQQRAGTQVVSYVMAPQKAVWSLPSA